VDPSGRKTSSLSAHSRTTVRSPGSRLPNDLDSSHELHFSSRLLKKNRLFRQIAILSGLRGFLQTWTELQSVSRTLWVIG
jgi:hypothetical protein